MVLQRFQFIKQVTLPLVFAGNPTLTFPTPPKGIAFTGSIAPTITSFPGLSTPATQPALTFGSIWNVYRNNIPVASFRGLQGIVDVQAWEQETITVVPQNIIPGVTVQVSWQGFSDDVQNVVPAQPWVFGEPGGIEMITPYTQVISVGPFAFNTSTIVASNVGFPNTTMWLLGYTITGSLNAQSTITGSRSWEISLNGAPLSTFGTVDQMNLTAVASTTSNMTISKDLSDDPYNLGRGATLTFNTGGSGASAGEATCTVAIVILP